MAVRLLGLTFQKRDTALLSGLHGPRIDSQWLRMLSAILKEANEEDAIKTKLNATLEVFECRGIRRRRICISSVNSTRPLEAATEVSDQPTAASYPATWSLNVDFRVRIWYKITSNFDVPGVGPWRHGRPQYHQPRIHRQHIPRQWFWTGTSIDAFLMKHASCTRNRTHLRSMQIRSRTAP